jgi:hypothetical protein
MHGGRSQIYMGIWLTDNGVDIGPVTFANLVMADAAAAMVSGQVAAAELWEPLRGRSTAPLTAGGACSSCAPSSSASALPVSVIYAELTRILRTKLRESGNALFRCVCGAPRHLRV